MRFRMATAVAAVLLSGTSLATAETLTIATVNNADMIIMQRLAPQFTEATGHELNWVVLEENTLRQRVTTDIATGSAQFDIVTIGAYETPIWGAAGWLVDVGDLGDDYDYEDVLKPVRDGLTADETLYAVPFYAESSFTYYRKDLFEAAGLTMPDKPTYEDIKRFAAALHKPEENVYGICLRGKPGWGENMAFVDTMVNTYGGRWFDMEWNTTINTPEWQAAITDYIDLLNNYGPPGSASNGHNETRALFSSGNCGIWIDATSAAGYVFNPETSRVADSVAFAASPVGTFTEGSGWAWSWALAIPETSSNQEAAKEFLKWATSKDYVRMVGESEGWVSVPPGTRQSTYDTPQYKEAAPFADATLEAIMTADPTKATRDPVPYTGVQFVAIPEFQGIGTQVGQTIAAALSGQMSVEQALQAAQSSTERTMRQSGYPK